DDLPIGYRNNVGRNVRRHVAGLGLYDWQRRERSSSVLIAHLRRALEQSRMEKENIARKGLRARGTAQKQRQLPISLRVLRQIIVDQQRVFAAVAEILSHRA